MSAAAARQFRSIMSQVSWRVRSAQVPNLPNPAALTSTATSGSSSLMRTRRVSTLSNRVRSRASGRIGVRSSAASASSRSPRRATPQISSSPPSASSRRTKAIPRPEEAPVTMAIFMRSPPFSLLYA